MGWRPNVPPHEGEGVGRGSSNNRFDRNRGPARNGEVGVVRDSLDGRFRRGLLTALANAKSAKQPGTILRRALAVADRLLAYEPPASEARASVSVVSDYDVLIGLEHALRGHIVRKLASLTPNWWKERIPEDVRKNAEDREAKRESLWPWQAARGLDPIKFVNLRTMRKSSGDETTGGMRSSVRLGTTRC